MCVYGSTNFKFLSVALCTNGCYIGVDELEQSIDEFVKQEGLDKVIIGSFSFDSGFVLKTLSQFECVH